MEKTTQLQLQHIFAFCHVSSFSSEHVSLTDRERNSAVFQSRILVHLSENGKLSDAVCTVMPHMYICV